MTDNNVALMAHLLRRAGFGASRDQIEAALAKGYQQTVDNLLNHESQPGIDEDVLGRYWPSILSRETLEDNQMEWIYRMVNDSRQLREKMTLFWHTIFCAGNGKVDFGRLMGLQIEMFRQDGMGNFRELLLKLSKDPAMLYYLDNTENHHYAVNENYGRELLELFSMGVGADEEFNYTEDDVKACARAFTGWNVGATLPVFPYGRTPWKFVYDHVDHDDSEKTFLGETGRWDGEDIIDIVCKQPSTARFISRKLYDFFVADEPPVPSWRQSTPRDPKAIKILEEAYFDSGYDISAMLRALFYSDFFQDEGTFFAKVKSPAELVAGTLRVVGTHTVPTPSLIEPALESRYMGMDLMNPPSVEGWHTGREWIDSGTLVERINFAADLLGNTELPGVKSIVDRLMAQAKTYTPEEFVDGCLDLVGPIEVAAGTKEQLVFHAKSHGQLRHGTATESTQFRHQTGEMLQLIASVAEFQLG